MERDFLGLNSKEPVATVKEEVHEGIRDSGLTLGQSMQPPFSNKVCAHTQFMAFKVSQEDEAKKVTLEPAAISRCMPMSTGDAFDRRYKCLTDDIQETLNHDKNGSDHFLRTAYPMSNKVHSANHILDVKTPPVSNISISTNNPVLKAHCATAGTSLSGTNMKQQLVGGFSIASQQPYFSHNGDSGGVSEPWMNSNASGSPAQMTVFYAGTVNVYDDISPEKAQAIMFLARKGSLVASNASNPETQFQEKIPKMVTSDTALVSQPINVLPSSGLPSPMSVSSRTGAQSASGSTCTEELKTNKITSLPASPMNKPYPPKRVNSLGYGAATNVMAFGVPQARKASLTRFLEKRKERVMKMTPYEKFSDCITQESNGMSVSATSGGSSAFHVD